MPATATTTSPEVSSAEFWALDAIARFHHSRDPSPSFWDVPASGLSLSHRSSAARLVEKGYLVRDRREDGVRFGLTTAGARLWQERQGSSPKVAEAAPTPIAAPRPAPTAAPHRPTHRSYTTLDAAYEHFNAALFHSELPACLITFQRKKGSLGYFCGERMASLEDGAIVDEIALNPMHFAEKGPEDVLSTLVHEMCHLWQHHFGVRRRRCYHDKQWASKMVDVGLIPSATGMPGGKMIGSKMDHYIDPAGPFARVAREFLGRHPAAGLYCDKPAEGGEGGGDKKERTDLKTKFTCPRCDVNAWGAPKLHLVCGDCNLRMNPRVREDHSDQD